MGIFNFFTKNKKKSESKKNENLVIESENIIPDYKNTIELTKIITNYDETAVKDISLLVENYTEFYEKHKNWCDEMGFDGDILLTFAYWLTGYDTDCKYGAYIDWKEATEDIIWNLEPAIKNLNYPLDLTKIEFSGNEFTFEALRVINEYFAKQGYTLVGLDTQSDCYHLFITKINDVNKIAALGKEINFKFFNKYE